MASHYIISPDGNWVEGVTQKLKASVAAQRVVLPDCSDWFSQKGSESRPLISRSDSGEFHALQLDSHEECTDRFTLYCPSLTEVLDDTLCQSSGQADKNQLLTLIGTWQKQASQILGFTLANRKQSYLIFDTKENSWAALSKRPELQVFFEFRSETGEPHRKVDAEKAFLALLLNTDRPLQELYRQLMSAANSSNHDSPGLHDKEGLSEALALYQKLWKIQQEPPPRKTDALEAELELAHLQIAQLQEELEEYFIKWKEAQPEGNANRMETTPDRTLQLATRILDRNPQLARR